MDGQNVDMPKARHPGEYPFNLDAAADWLEAFVKGTEPLQPLLPIGQWLGVQPMLQIIFWARF